MASGPRGADGGSLYPTPPAPYAAHMTPWLRPSLAALLTVVLGCDDDGPAEDDSGQSYCDSCTLDVQIPLVAREGATDCGRVALDDDPSAVVACIEQALAAGTPFIARQQLQGIDSSVERAYVTNDDGVVEQLAYDSNICGGAGGCMDGCGPRVSSTACTEPSAGAMPMQAIVDCASMGSIETLCEPPS